jgi:hypothetical protein
MKKSNLIIGASILLTAIMALGSYLIYDNCSTESRILSMIRKNLGVVNYYCKANNINPRIYISIIYGELHSNYNFFDDFDNLRAEYGFDPSAGFGQMKVSTLMWLEENYSDGKIISKSRNRKEAVSKLLNDTSNIAYSVFYIKLISQKLRSITAKEPTVKQLGSFYSLGIDHGKREINSDFTSPVGLAAEKFYYSDDLIEIYPRQ